MRTYDIAAEWPAFVRATLTPGLVWRRAMIETYLSMMAPMFVVTRPPARRLTRIVPVPTTEQQRSEDGEVRPRLSMYGAMDNDELAETVAFHERQAAYHAAWQDMLEEGHDALALESAVTAPASAAATEIVWTEELPTIGRSVTTSRTFHADDVIQFASLSGDKNPLHLEADAWIGTPFTGNLVHGVLTASLFSQLMGMQLPGPGTVYLSQILKFQAPVYVGESVSAEVTVTQVREDKRIITLQTRAWVTRDGQSVTVLDGEAVVKVLTRPALGKPTP